ncbi:MAG: OmpA family protein [Deltaproteobacteria bacterium]|nr:OmpA family protein [Deltaproteobacteria bacterium]
MSRVHSLSLPLLGLAALVLSAFPTSAFAQDADMDSILDTDEAGVDTDMDGVDDDLDTDSDNDRILDIDEAGDDDPMTPPIDTDMDGTPDFRDDDSDGDGLGDRFEAGDDDELTAPVDTDLDGTPDFLDTDSDDDGLDDELESGGFPPIDTDGDGIPDYLDTDSDGDGRPDFDETPFDLDGDGIADFRDPDADGDGVNDGVDGCPLIPTRDQADLDGDGEGDACDDDYDGDTIDNDVDVCPFVADPAQLDSDGDGIGDACVILDGDRDGWDDRLGVSGGGCAAGGSGHGGALALLLMVALVGFRRRGALLALLAAGIAITSTASAQTAPVERQDFSVERFRLATDRGGILDVEWAAVPGHLRAQGALWVGYADDPLVLYRRSPDDDDDDDIERDRVSPLVDHRTTASAVFALPLFDTLSVGFELPLVLYQNRPTLGLDEGLGATANDLATTGFGDLRLVAKVQLLQAERHGLDLAVMPVFTVPMGGNDSYFRERDFTFAPELLISRASLSGAFRFSLNVGYQVREKTQLVNLEVDDEVSVRLGIAGRLGKLGAPPIELDLSVAMAFAASDSFDNASQTPFEIRAGATYDAHELVAPFIGAGVGVVRGYGTPDWRVFAGVRVGLIGEETGPCDGEVEDIDGFEDDDGCADPDNDEDGILDERDDCPDEAEDVDGFEDDDGCRDYDNDGDGVLDARDECPLEAEPPGGNGDGCPNDHPDADGDGIEDSADRCVEEPEDRDEFEDEDGCPDLDNDEDGIADGADRCPLEAGVAENHGCPDTDRDEDGVPDRIDNCPDEPGTAERQGCRAPQQVRIEETQLVITDKVYFAHDSARILGRSNRLLDNIAAVLVNHPEIEHVRVEGHTDSSGARDHNVELSLQRAQAVMAYLVGKEVAAERLEARGLGPDRPVADNDTAEGRAQNRRVEFLIGEAEPEAAAADAEPAVSDNGN